jgi:CDP-glycerol glycerophosphotransferase
MSGSQTADGAYQLSVVVPVYNVAEYAAASLDSILRQPVEGVEVVVVDDGSTDGSAAVVADHAARYDNVRLVTQENSGVSTARNVAVPMCRGELLTFVDPDDELPADAWTRMIDTLRRTGSDFVVGAAERVEGERRFMTPLMRRNHAEERLGVRIEEAPLMLADVFVWNKVFRRDWWLANRIWFPERTRYQDQVALTQAFLAARSFDVLTDVVYEWRVRADRSSATQRRREVANLTERMTTKQMTLDQVEAHGDQRILEVLMREVMPIDMWEHFRAATHAPAPDEYWRLLRDGTRSLWPAARPFERTGVPAQQRMMGWLVGQDRFDDLVALVRHLDAGGGVRFLEVDGRLEADVPLRRASGVPQECFVAAEHELGWARTRVR